MKEHSSLIEIAYREKPTAENVLGFLSMINKPGYDYFYVSIEERKNSCVWDFGICSDENNLEGKCIEFCDISTRLNTTNVGELIDKVLTEFVRRQKLVESKKKMDRLNRDFE